MLTVPLKDILSSLTMFKLLSDMEFPFSTARKIRRLINVVNHEATEYYSYVNSLIRTYGVPVDGDAGKYEFTDENRKTFTELLTQAQSVVIPINEEPLTIAELGEFPVRPEDLEGFEKFIAGVEA